MNMDTNKNIDSEIAELKKKLELLENYKKNVERNSSLSIEDNLKTIDGIISTHKAILLFD